MAKDINDDVLQDRVNSALEEFGKNHVVFMTKHKILLSVVFGWIVMSGLVLFALLISDVLYVQGVAELDRIIPLAYGGIYAVMFLLLIYEIYKKIRNHAVNDKAVIINDRFWSPFVKANFGVLLLTLCISVAEILLLTQNQSDINIVLQMMFLIFFLVCAGYLHIRTIRSYLKLSSDYLFITPELSEIGKWNSFFTQDILAFNTNQIKSVTSERDSWSASLFNYGTLHFRLESLKQTEPIHIRYIACPRKIEHRILEIASLEEDEFSSS